MNFAEKNLGPEDGITQNLRNVFENAKIELDTALYKRGGKKGKGKGKKRVMAAGASGMVQHEMLTPRQDMEQVDEEAEDAMAANLANSGEHDEGEHRSMEEPVADGSSAQVPIDASDPVEAPEGLAA